MVIQRAIHPDSALTLYVNACFIIDYNVFLEGVRKSPDLIYTWKSGLEQKRKPAFTVLSL